MTLDRSLDDLPLAAYGGSGMELNAVDKAKLQATPRPEADQHATTPSTAPSGPLAPASEVAALTEGEPGPARALPVVLQELATRGITLVRTSRVAQGAVFGGVIVVGLLLLVGGGTRPGAAGAEASPSAGPAAAASREPGNATLVLTGEVKQALTFSTSAGAGAPNAPLAFTWMDTTANSIGLNGPVDRGTRSTAETLVLQWTVVVDEQPVTFTSTDGECTLGMAVTPTSVQGTFSCKKLKSDDGKYVVGASGTYRT